MYEKMTDTKIETCGKNYGQDENVKEDYNTFVLKKDDKVVAELVYLNHKLNIIEKEEGLIRGVGRNSSSRKVTLDLENWDCESAKEFANYSAKLWSFVRKAPESDDKDSV